jgi:hypothetical protein
MGVGEKETVLGESVDVRCIGFGLFVVTDWVAVAEVVGED